MLIGSETKLRQNHLQINKGLVYCTRYNEHPFNLLVDYQLLDHQLDIGITDVPNP
jgi:hypothetical protein